MDADQAKAIRARWDTSHDRTADDYTDEGCRVLARAAFRDVPVLLAEVERLRDGIRQHRKAAQGAVPGPWLEADRRLWALLDDQENTTRKENTMQLRDWLAAMDRSMRRDDESNNACDRKERTMPDTIYDPPAPDGFEQYGWTCVYHRVVCHNPSDCDFVPLFRPTVETRRAHPEHRHRWRDLGEGHREAVIARRR